jgi:hypothetical protein
MKKYFALSLIAILAGLLMFGCSKDPMSSGETAQTQSMSSISLSHTAADPFVVELIADGGDPLTAVDVGEILVWNDGSNLFVKYVIDGDLTTDPADDVIPSLLTETHVHVAASLAEIPQTKKGNPKIGQFDYQSYHDPGVDQYVVVIPLTWNIDDEIYVAAHAVVEKIGGLTGLEIGLPAQVTMKVQYPYGGGPAYFPTTTVSGGTILDGTYPGWCVDTDHTIGNNTNYVANVYSSYENLPAGLIEYPENLDLVNWIINQGFVGTPSPGCAGNYTYGDVQRAIWTLVEDNNSTSGLGSWSACRVAEILAAAQSNGEGYEPGCYDYVAVILVPVTGSGAAQQVIIAQVTLIEVPILCETLDETAWGGFIDIVPPVYGFPGDSWAMYFNYMVQ